MWESVKEILAILVSGVSVGYVLNYIYKKTRGHPKKGNNSSNVLKIHGVFLGMGVFSILAGLFFMWMWIDPNSVGFKNDIPRDPDSFFVMTMMVGGAFIIGMLSIFYHLIYEIAFNNTKVKGRGIFGIKTELFWEEVDNLTFNPSSMYLTLMDKDRKRKIRIHLYLVGFSSFFEFLKKRIPDKVDIELIKRIKKTQATMLPLEVDGL